MKEEYESELVLAEENFDHPTKETKPVKQVRQRNQCDICNKIFKFRGRLIHHRYINDFIKLNLFMEISKPFLISGILLIAEVFTNVRLKNVENSIKPKSPLICITKLLTIPV